VPGEGVNYTSEAYGFVKANQAYFHVTTMCRVLEVVRTWAGFLYLAIVLDVWSHRVVGWAMATHLRTELVLDGMDMALEQRRPEGVIHRSDKGCQ